MSTVPKKLLTESEYLAVERAASIKSEFYRGEMFAMAGVAHEHNRIKDNLVFSFRRQFQGGPCYTLSSDQRIVVRETGLFTYPDVAVVCGQAEFLDGRRDVLLNPKIIVEVLSNSTEAYDRGTKFEHYRQIPSLQEYVLVSQYSPSIDCFQRNPNRSWLLTSARGTEELLALASVDASLVLAEIYSGIEFPPPQLSGLIGPS